MVEVKVRDRPIRLIDALWEAGIPVEGLCGGMGLCGKCVVKVIRGSDNLNPRTPREAGLDHDERLACMAWAMRGSVDVEPVRRSGSNFVAIGYEPTVPLKPAVRMIKSKLSQPTLENQVPDDVNLMRESGSRPRHLWVYRKMPQALRDCGWSVNVVSFEGDVIDVRCDGDVLGAAIDIGSTKIAVHLVNMRSGDTAAYGVTENPQVTYGVDIISRAAAAMSDARAAEQLRSITIKAINELIARLANDAGSSVLDVAAAAVAGNTVMTQLFLGISINNLVQSPYIPSIGLPSIFAADDVGLSINPAAPVLVLPSVAGFIGGDAVADALAAGMHRPGGPRLLIDIGTNTEVMLRVGDKILAASAPAGSAIEGVGISSGVRAVDGAIEAVQVIDGKLRAVTIGNKSPIGITGTGLIDLAAALLQLGAMSRSGKLIPGPFVETINGVPAVIIDGVTVTQRDIRLLQEAKAAIQSTWKALLRLAGVAESDLAAVYIAGSFGTHLNPNSAAYIGLIPRSRVIFLGNASISGAKLVLRNFDYWSYATRVVESIKVVETAAMGNYEKAFLESTLF
ncbi:ASKHA domain-containing protein [Thermocladium modestius]|nr:ASKHA domain-containing protein [Thermocladium modestius]